MSGDGKSRSGGRGLAMRRLYRQVLETIPGVNTQTRPISDPGMQGANETQSFYNTAQVVFGEITDATAIASCYRVQCEKGRSPVPCLVTPTSSISAVGARSLRTLQPGTTVIVILHPQKHYGVIIGTIPLPQTAGNLALPEMITQASRQRCDEAHKRPLKMQDNGMITDWLCGRAFDATTIGEEGWVTETGLKVQIDPFLVQLSVDEATGVFGFYHDMLLRVAGHNLQVWTACSERESYDDQGEGNDFQFYTPYPWEGRGLFERGDPHIERPGQAWQIDEPHYAIWEPMDDWQQPWHREQHFHGYLGQGGKKLIITEPIAPPQLNTYEGGGGTGFNFTGLFDQNNSLDGRLFIQSAKGIHLVKGLGICPPKRMRRPEQYVLGDDDTNYKAASEIGGGPDHKITGDIETTDDSKVNQRAAGIFDLHAYLFNYSGLHPFFWHTKDWDPDMPEESEIAQTGGFTILPIPFGKLASDMYLEQPEPITIKIDHRDEYTEQEFFQNTSGIDLLEDGGVVIHDGYGAELKMTGGSITLSAPGDIWCKAGRNVINWGGFDVILRAKNSMDLSANDKDVRIKAEKNMQLMAGNKDNTGGILLESRSESPAFVFDGVCGEDVISSGIMLKAAKTGVTAWGRDIYLRTLSGEGSTAGPIILDADQGKKDIVTNSKTLTSFVETSVIQSFGDSPSNPEKVNVFSADGTTLSSQICIDGGIVVIGQIACRGGIAVAGGHIATEFAEAASFFVAPLTGNGLAQVQAVLGKCDSLINTELPDITGSVYDVIFTDGIYEADRVGNEDTIKAAQFSYRSVEQYKTEDFKMYEDRWQQMRRLGTGQAEPTWTENPVECTAEPETYPYPGKEKFTEPTLLEPEVSIFDLEAGHSKDRGTSPGLAGEYANPKYEASTPKPLDGTYQIIRG